MLVLSNKRSTKTERNLFIDPTVNEISVNSMRPDFSMVSSTAGAGILAVLLIIFINHDIAKCTIYVVLQ